MQLFESGQFPTDRISPSDREQLLRGRLDGAKIVGGGFACPAVRDDLERDLLTLIEGTQASALDGADMNENVLAAAFRLNKAKSFLAVKPLHSSNAHGDITSR
jgi:hypothetical protein